MQISSQLNKWHTQILKSVIEEKGWEKTKYNDKMAEYSRKDMDFRAADLGSDSALDVYNITSRHSSIHYSFNKYEMPTGCQGPC